MSSPTALRIAARYSICCSTASLWSCRSDGVVAVEGAEADGGDAPGHALPGLSGGLFGGVAADVPVDAHLGAGQAAEQLVDRHAVGLALDVPQRHVDGADGRPGGRTAAVEPAAEARLPQVLDPLRVFADQVRDQVLQHPLRRVRDEVVGGVAVADDAGVGLDLEEDVAAGQNRLDAGDLHARALLPLGGCRGNAQHSGAGDSPEEAPAICLCLVAHLFLLRSGRMPLPRAGGSPPPETPPSGRSPPDHTPRPPAAVRARNGNSGATPAPC